MLDESREKPPFFPPFTAPKKRAREPAGWRGATRFHFHGDTLSRFRSQNLLPLSPSPPTLRPLLLARLLLLRLFNRIVLASDSCGVGNKIQNAKQQTRRAASRQSQALRAVHDDHGFRVRIREGTWLSMRTSAGPNEVVLPKGKSAPPS